MKRCIYDTGYLKNGSGKIRNPLSTRYKSFHFRNNRVHLILAFLAILVALFYQRNGMHN
jgi:hypothetical protein